MLRSNSVHYVFYVKVLLCECAYDDATVYLHLLSPERYYAVVLFFFFSFLLRLKVQAVTAPWALTDHSL